MAPIEDNVFIDAYEGKTNVVAEKISKNEDYLTKQDTVRIPYSV